MKIIKKLLIVGTAALLASCGSSQVAIKETSSAPSGASSKEERLALQIHNEVNRYRASQGLKELKFHSGLAKLAKPHSQYMRANSGKFSVDAKYGLITHYGFEGRKNMASHKYRIESLGENVIASDKIGEGSEFAAAIVEGWLNSSNHVHNIRSKWSQTGIAVSLDENGRAYATQLFGSAPSQLLRVGGPNNIGEW